MRQQENQLAGMEKCLIRFRTNSKDLSDLKAITDWAWSRVILDPTKPKIQIGELSMSRPEEFKQDFDWRYSKIAAHV